MFKKIALCAVLSVAASASFAATPSFYAGADIGKTKVDGISGRETSYGGFIGYQINENFAVEGGIRRLSDYDFKLGTATLGVTLDQYALSGLGFMPLTSEVRLYGRLGYNRLKAEGKLSGLNANESTNKAVYGVGVDYAFSPVISGRIEFQKPSSDSTNLSAGVSFKF